MFEVTASNIECLNDEQLTDLLRILLLCEASKHGIVHNSVNVSLKMKTGDNGEDGIIKWQGKPRKTDFLPCRKVLFQCKATAKSKSMTGNKCAEEINKEHPRDIIDKKGAYILFCTESYSPKMHKDRINKMYEVFDDSEQNSISGRILIYDANKIRDWTNQYVSAIAFVLTAIGCKVPKGIKIWHGFMNHPEHQNKYFRIKNDLNILKDYFKENEGKKVFRISGPSGIGKTRLALEFLKQRNNLIENGEEILISEEEIHSYKAVYFDLNDNPDLRNIIANFINQNKHGLIVVDNCSVESHMFLLEEIYRTDCHLDLITIGIKSIHDEKNCLEIREVNLNIILKIVGSAYPALCGADRHKVSELSEGNPYAALKCARIFSNRKSISHQSDQSLQNGLLKKEFKQNEKIYKVITILSIFERIGFYGDVSFQYELIAELIHINPTEFYSIVKKQLIEHQLVKQYGRFMQIQPTALAIALASNWWDEYHPSNAIKLINYLKEVSIDLCIALFERLALLDSSNTAILLAEALLNSKHYQSINCISVKQELQIFLSLAEVQPILAMKCLEVMSDKNMENFINIDKAIQEKLFAHVKKLSLYQKTYNISMNILIKHAAANNDVANKYLCQLFEISRPGEVSYIHYLNFLDAIANNPELLGECIKSFLASLHVYLMNEYHEVYSTPKTPKISILSKDLYIGSQPSIDYKDMEKEDINLFTEKFFKILLDYLRKKQHIEQIKVIVDKYFYDLIIYANKLNLKILEFIKEVLVCFQSNNRSLTFIFFEIQKFLVQSNSLETRNEFDVKINSIKDLITENSKKFEIFFNLKDIPKNYNKDILRKTFEEILRDEKSIKYIEGNIQNFFTGEGIAYEILSALWAEKIGNTNIDPFLQRAFSEIEKSRFDLNLQFLDVFLHKLYELYAHQTNLINSFMIKINKNEITKKYIFQFYRTIKFEDYKAINILNSMHIVNLREYYEFYKADLYDNHELNTMLERNLDSLNNKFLLLRNFAELVRHKKIINEQKLITLLGNDNKLLKNICEKGQLEELDSWSYLANSCFQQNYNGSLVTIILENIRILILSKINHSTYYHYSKIKRDSKIKDNNISMYLSVVLGSIIKNDKYVEILLNILKKINIDKTFNYEQSKFFVGIFFIDRYDVKSGDENYKCITTGFYNFMKISGDGKFKILHALALNYAIIGEILDQILDTSLIIEILNNLKTHSDLSVSNFACIKSLEYCEENRCDYGKLKVNWYSFYLDDKNNSMPARDNPISNLKYVHNKNSFFHCEDLTKNTSFEMNQKKNFSL